MKQKIFMYKFYLKNNCKHGSKFKLLHIEKFEIERAFEQLRNMMEHVSEFKIETKVSENQNFKKQVKLVIRKLKH